MLPFLLICYELTLIFKTIIIFSTYTRVIIVESFTIIIYVTLNNKAELKNTQQEKNQIHWGKNYCKAVRLNSFHGCIAEYVEPSRYIGHDSHNISVINLKIL